MSIRLSRSAAESLGVAPRAREARPRGRRASGSATPEGAILRDCLRVLGLRPDVVAKAWRNNTGSLRDATGRPVGFGLPGSSDILGVLRWSGRFLAVECKAPGGKPTALQLEFLRGVRDAGGVALIIDNPAWLAAILGWLDGDPMARFDLDGALKAPGDRQDATTRAGR